MSSKLLSVTTDPPVLETKSKCVRFCDNIDYNESETKRLFSSKDDEEESIDNPMDNIYAWMYEGSNINVYEANEFLTQIYYNMTSAKAQQMLNHWCKVCGSQRGLEARCYDMVMTARCKDISMHREHVLQAQLQQDKQENDVSQTSQEDKIALISKIYSHKSRFFARMVGQGDENAVVAVNAKSISPPSSKKQKQEISSQPQSYNSQQQQRRRHDQQKTTQTETVQRTSIENADQHQVVAIIA